MDKMEYAAEVLCKMGFILRSGGAPGADSAFESGYLKSDSSMTKAEVYVPWDGFNGRTVERWVSDIIVPSYQQFCSAQEIVKHIHPVYGSLSASVRKLHCRNVFQVLGLDLATPSAFVICYAPEDRDGEPTGGTRTAIKVAEMHGIPVLNLFQKSVVKRLDTFLENQYHKHVG